MRNYIFTVDIKTEQVLLCVLIVIGDIYKTTKSNK